MYKNKVLTAIRYFVGILFIFSGLVKANDPAGLSYKMLEFFEVWQWHGLEVLALPLSIAMIIFEIIAGVAVIIGWRFPLFAWMLLLLILFFTFLTGYAVLSGKVRECGCFGDCIPLKAEQSFTKDIILLGLIVLLTIKRNSVTFLGSERTSIAIISIAALLSLCIQLYVLKHLPFVDCLPYKKGKDILEQMKIPEGSVPDSISIEFVYVNRGKEVSFDVDHFPADFNDSTYTFVRRVDRLVRKGNAIPPIRDFVIITAAGVDTTKSFLEQPGQKIIIFSRELTEDPTQWAWASKLKDISNLTITKNIPLIWVSSDAEKLLQSLPAIGLGHIPVLKGDGVAIKTAARVDPTLYWLDGARILGKWAAADFSNTVLEINGKTINKVP